MATSIKPGQTSWSMTRDDDGHRNYSICFRVVGATTDGPATVLLTPGLPLPGSPWAFDNDYDPWATCKLDTKVTPVLKNEPNKNWDVEFTFSTRPNKRCQDNQVEDPLLEPPRVRLSFNKYTEEATKDRFGNPILNSAHEQIRGPQVEFDANRLSVSIEMNVANLDLGLLDRMKDTVNNAPLWGLPRRCVKLSSATAEKKYWGQCCVYYTISLEFDTAGIKATGTVKTAVSAVVSTEGTDYTVGDSITVIGGSSSSAAVFTVAGFSGDTTVVTLASGGSYSTTPANPTATTSSGTGTGMMLSVTWEETGNWQAGGTGGFDRDLLDEGTKVLKGYWGSTTIAGTGSVGTGGDWILSLIGGAYPDPTNPSHFIRAVDRHGNPMRMILDGGGLPADVIVGADRKTYLSVANLNGPGNPLEDDLLWWIEVSRPVTPSLWNHYTEYVIGDLVYLTDMGTDAVFYVCKNSNINVIPPQVPEWLEIPVGFNDRGYYDATTIYARGDYVSPATEAHGPGVIHVEKYDEQNLLLLGIPTVL